MTSNVISEQENEGKASPHSQFEAQRNKLQIIVQSEFGLLSKLRSSGVLTVTDEQTIKADNTTIGRNQKLLQAISERGKYHEFIDALRKSGQTHVVNLINGNGVYRPEFGLDWPLTEREIGILDSNYDQLGEMLNVKEELIRILFSRLIINERQKDFISSKLTSCEANEAFLHILRQSSLKTYFLTVQYLRELNEVRTANILENVAVAVPVHVSIGGENVDEVETQLIKKLTLLYLEDTASCDTADFDRILAWLRVSIISAKKGLSIVLFVSCCTVDEFRQLCTITDNNDIKKVLEKLFNQLLQNFLSKVLLARITESDREKAETLFQRELLRDKKYDDHFQQLCSQLKYEEPMAVTTEESIEESKEEELPQESEEPSISASVEDTVDHEKISADFISQTKMEILPLEMLDKILLKTVRRMMVVNSSEAFKSFDELMYQVLNHLRTISLLWDSRLHATEWVKIQLRHLRKTSKERDHKTKNGILDCYAIFVKNVELSALRMSLIQFRVVKREKLNHIFNKSSNNQSRCRAFLDHLFIEGHPLAFLAMQQILDGSKADILEYMDGRKTCTMTEEGSKFLNNDDIKAIVSTEDIYDQLIEDMDTDRLGDWLKQEGIISIKEWQGYIAPLVNIKDRRHSTLEYLSTISHPRVYIILRQVLIQDHPNIATAIDNAASEAEKKYDILNQIMKHREFLMERMDAEFGLQSSLRAKGILTNEDIEDIETETTDGHRNGRLLDCVSMNRSRNSADLFIEALKENDQGHLVNYMISDGVYDSKFADEWSLTETDIQSIDSNYADLIDLLETTDGLLAMLCETGAINSKQREFISSKLTSQEKNKGFLKILKKKSLRNYKETIRCLRMSKQNHIATILETGEGGLLWDYEDCIARNYNLIYTYIAPVDYIVGSLLTRNVLTHPQMMEIKEIERKRGRRDAIDRMIQLMRLHGNRGFECFIEALVSPDVRLDRIAKMIYPQLAERFIKERDSKLEDIS